MPSSGLPLHYTLLYSEIAKLNHYTSHINSGKWCGGLIGRLTRLTKRQHYVLCPLLASWVDMSSKPPLSSRTNRRDGQTDRRKGLLSVLWNSETCAEGDMMTLKYIRLNLVYFPQHKKAAWGNWNDCRSRRVHNSEDLSFLRCLRFFWSQCLILFLFLTYRLRYECKFIHVSVFLFLFFIMFCQECSALKQWLTILGKWTWGGRGRGGGGWLYKHFQENNTIH